MALWDKIQTGTPNNSSATKTPYQQIFSKPVQQEWKVGDQPTNYGQALATINAMYKVNPTGAQEKLSLLNQYRTQPGNMWYDAYAAPTNRDVDTLKAYGIDPTELTSDWFNANNGWQAYLRYNGTTNTPSKPTKKSTDQEKLSYALYQYQKSMDITNAAKNEWTAAQGEINYWANRKDLNLSDDDIIKRVFGSGKYSTLKKMDDSRSTGSPLELNDAIDYNQDSVRGAIWAARNGGGTGNIRQDIANYYLKSGNSWKDDPNISAKLNIDNLETFSRYEVGMAGDGMDNAGVYFGVPSFSKADVEALRNNVDWEDETSVKMYQTVLAAEETTEKAEAELANLTKAFQRRLNRGFKDQNEANKWIDSQLESSDYSTLAKMDASLKSGKIMDMTRAVPYRKQMLQQMAADSIANPKKTGSEILSSYGMPVNDADDSVTRVENEKVGSSIDALGAFLSQGEKDYFDAVPGVDYAKITAGYNGIAEGMKSGMINITNHATKYAEEANGKYNKAWLGSLASRNQYERYQATADRLAAEVEDFEKNNGTQILASESIESEPVFSLDDGTQVQLIYDDETGEYEVGNVWNDMWRFGQTSPEQLAAANEKAEQLRIEQNNRANGIRAAQADAGEMDADTIKGVEEYNKKKEQLAALNGYLDENKTGYEQSIRDAEIAKANRDALGAIAAKALGVEYDPSTADSIMQYAGGWYDYESPPADGITLVEESAVKTTEDINKEIADNNANVQDLQFVLSMLGDNAPEDLKQKINQAISDAERQNRVYGDYMITKNPRFDYLARKGQESLHFTEMDEPVEGMNKNWFFMMSDEEKKIYYALVNTDGVEAADRFYTDIRDELQQRRQNQIEGVTKQIAESGWLGRLASEVGAVLIAPINTLAGVAYTAGVALGADEAEMSAAKQSSHISQSMHNANVTEIKKVYSDPETGEETALSKALSGLYEIMYNRGNSLMNAITWGKLMPHLAAEGKVADFINSVISATPIALSAASDALESAIDRGADPTQQAIIFASTLIAESWTEGIEFGHIEEAGKLLLTKQGITTFLKNYIPNAMSEVVGESANDLIENAADYWVKYINNPDYKTQHDEAVKKALAEDDTLTPEQAEALVHQAEVDGVLHTAIISFFSPGADVVSMAGNTLTTYYGYAKEARAYNNGLQPQVRLYNSKSIRDIRLEHEAAQQEQPVRVERQEETPQTEQTEQAEPEQYPVNGPEPNTRNFRERGAYGEAMDAYETGIMALESAMEADATTKAAAIASTINTGNPYMAQAAAAKLDIVLTQGLLYAGKQSNINIKTLSTGLQLAALGDGMCAQIMNTGIETGMGIYDMAQQIAAAVGADMQNPSVIQGVTAGIHDARVNEEFKRLMATGLADAAIEAQAKVDTAREATRAAEQEAEQKNNELDAARKGVSDAAAAVAADPINDGNQMTGALAKMTSAAAVAQEYAQKLDKARKEQQKVEDENRKAIESTTAYMRQQAEKTVAQQEAEENAQAQADAQARVESERAAQMAQNITTLQTEDFVEKYYPNATEEQKENIAQRIDYMKQQTSAEAILDRAQFVKNLSNKFGTKIRVADTTEGGKKPRSNAYVDINTGEIVVDRNSTMSDIIYAVLPHELVHLAEKSGNYKALADTLLQIKYGQGVTYDAVLQAANSGNRGDVTATAVVDVLAHKALYDSTLGATHTNEYALHETVADLMGSLFRSGENGGVNTELVNRLVTEEPNVAKRIMNAIKSFIRKMAGFNDPALTQAQAAVDMLNAALKERTASTNAKAQNRKADKSNHAEYEIRKSQFSDNPTVRFNTMPSEAQNAALRTIGMIPYKDSHGWGWRLNRGVKLTADQISKAIAAAENSASSDPIEFANEIMAAAGINNVRHSLDTKALVTDDQGNELATELPGGTVALDTERFSLSTFDAEEQNRVRESLLNAKDDNGVNLFTEDEVDKYMTDALGIASMIAKDKARLDFEADKDQVFLKKNQDYYFTLDASTLCAKRLLYQGTFNAIQKMMPNEALMPDDLIDLVNIMREMGYETPCGICYVESRRRWLDKYAQEWLDSFKGIKGEPMPTLADLTTSDGLSEMNVQGSPKYAPKTRQAFIDAMSAKGSANPKVVQLRTEYNGDIRKLSDADIQKVKDIGGLRIQSFSDFETPHLLDMIQAVYDMAAVRLTSQAYTKVPNFAWVFGDTGIKINLSLIGKGTGLDADGNLVFDDVEGMNFEQAMRLRDRYSKNVGTILVGINDEHIIAAMGDPRIDFIIPFHKSGWSHGELSRIPVLNSYKDYTATQNEQYIIEDNIVKEKGKGQKAVDNWIAKNGEKYPGYKVIDEGNGQFTIEYRDGYKSESFTKHKERTGEKLSNFEPVGANQYWNFDESGEWNARKYLQMCAESKRLPKFYQFLVDNGDGSFSLPEGNDKRSTAIREGYWKTLIDFKMYENDGYGRTKEDGTRTEVRGSRQTEVTPNVNMQQAERVMEEHKLGRQMPKRADGTDGPFIPMKSNNDLPTAEPAAAAFAEFLKYKRQRQEKLTRERLARNPKKESDDARNKRIAREGAEIYQAYSARNAFGASANIPLMDQTADTSSEEPVQARQSRMAIDAETGETVDIRHSLSDIEIDMDDVDKAVADYIANMSNDELLDYLGLNLPKSWSSEEQVQEFKQEVKSRKQLNAEYDTAINNGDIAKAGELADEAAKKAGYTLKGIHRTNGRFTVFDKSKQTGERGKTLGNAFYISSPAGSEYDSDSYGKNRMEVYVRPGRMFNLHNGLSKQKAEMVYDKYFKPFVSNDFGNTYKNHVLEKLQNGFRTMDYIDEAAEKNGTTTDEIFKWLGYNSIKDGPQYAIFDPSQIKLADPITYDDEGNVIPLGKRFKKANDDIRYSLPADAPYLAAVERGEMDEAAAYVRQKAAESGAFTNERGRPIKLYHGTKNGFGFTVFDTSRAGWGLGAIWTTSNPSVARGYSDFGYDRYASSKFIPDDGTDETIIRNAKNVLNSDVERLSEEKENEIRQKELEKYRALAEMENEAMGESQDYSPPSEIDYDFWNVVQAFNNILGEDEFLFNDDLSYREAYRSNYSTQHDIIGMNLVDARDRIREYFNNNDSEMERLKNDGSGYYNLLFRGFYHGDGIIDLEYSYKPLLRSNDNFIYTATDQVVSREDLERVIEQEERRGSYTLYGFPGDNPLEIDAEKAFWTGIKAPIIGEGYYSTDSIVKWAKANGYTSVIIRNVMDPGVVNAYGDDYVFFNANQLKSADAVTYDDSGNVIPLSERFNDQNEDIRYSLPSGTEENAIYIPDGHTNTGETVDFISKILDDEKGGETRNHNRLTRKWVGMAKDGKVYGRVRFGEPYLINNKSPEYESAWINGTDYDIGDGESKYYYPVLEKEDFRDNPRPIIRNGNYGQYQYSLPSPEILDQQIRHYLTAPLEGENPSATIPSEGNAQRQFGSQTAQRSDELDASVRQFLKDNSGYIPDTNEAQINRAIQWIRSNKNSNESDGLAESIQKIAMEDFDYRSADGQARMIATMGLAVAKKDAIAQAALADAYNRQGTDLGRALQARKLFRLMTPAGRVETLRKMLQNTQDELAAKGRKIDLKFSDWVYMAASAANNEGDFRKVQKRAAEELAAQIPANWKDRVRALRMLAMLGNTRTHIRNFVGNMLFVPAVGIKNKMAAVAELGMKVGDRTKTVAPILSKEVRDYARKDAVKMKDDLTGDSRWNEGNAVRREMKPFKGTLQKLIDFNGNMLEKEDWFFLKGHYRRAFGGWMQANGYTAQQLDSNPALLEKGRAYAIEEAQKATYRDANKLAQTLNKVSREGGVAGFLVDAVLPFKKTPANILRRGIEYSPVGVMKTLLADGYHLKQYMDAKNGKLSVMPDKAISPNQFIDHLCAGLTGSAIMAVGALLASMGIASAGMDDDDDKFDELRGDQKYSLNLSKLFGVKLFGQDVTYTMDWAAPMSMPFFVGAAIFDQLNGERGDFNIENLINDLGAMAEPVFNLSMLDGVNTLFQTSQYDDTNTITQIGGKIVSNYVTSYVPSMVGAVARTFDPVRRKSFVKSGEGGGLMGTWRYAYEQTQNKIPGWSQTNIPYRNAWGEADENSIADRIGNWLSPGYISLKKEDPVLDELERLYNSTEVDDSTRNNMIPKLPNKAISGTALEAEQYDAVTIQRGQTAKNLLTELMNTDYFKSAADQDRAKMVSDVWTFATQTANNAAVGRKMDGWVLNTQTNPVQGIINRSKKTVADETKDGWKAEAVQAVQMGDFDALDVCIERLGELGVKKSSVKTAVGNAFKEDYIKAYQRDDYATMYDIEGTLEDTGLFTYADFEKWLDDMNKAIIEDEEI